MVWCGVMYGTDFGRTNGYDGTQPENSREREHTQKAIYTKQTICFLCTFIVLPLYIAGRFRLDPLNVTSMTKATIVHLIHARTMCYVDLLNEVAGHNVKLIIRGSGRR